MSERLTQLQQMLAKQPNDAFLLYGVAMELKKLQDFPQSLAFLDRTIAVDPNYCYAYFQRGQVLELAGDAAGARLAYLDGIEAAKRAGDAHAQSELQGALDMLG